MAEVVQFSAPGVVEVVAEPERELRPDQVRIRTLYSGISAGTELTAYRGSNPYLTKRWDDDLRLFVEGAQTFEYPVSGWGYEECGRIVEVGRDVDDLRVGDVIWGRWGHRTDTVLDAEYARHRVLPANCPPIIGIFSEIGAIALNVVLDADIHLGETVAVFGLGVPGQIAAQMARLNGATVIAVDGIEARRDTAAALGAHHVIDPLSVDVAATIRSLTEGRGADVCLEISGNYSALHEAVRSVAYSSRVCAAGFFQGDGAGLRLGEEFHHNRVQIVGSQISGVAPGLRHRWDAFRLTRTAMTLAATGALHLEELVTHRLPVRDAAEAFRLLDEGSREALQVVLTFESES
ncbi:zinc-binding dehydrogenase [Microbacterium insulae]|uniref:Zinc-binding dehydrogenase n=1 Tax=Microbacterium insulae TaxID=483014 RepID=A0ABW3AHB0_9MICO